jgi:predicted membrane-bound spermidine synthase
MMVRIVILTIALPFFEYYFMELSVLDYSLIIGFFVIVLGIGIYVSKTSGKNTTEYFLSQTSWEVRLLSF